MFFHHKTIYWGKMYQLDLLPQIKSCSASTCPLTEIDAVGIDKGPVYQAKNCSAIVTDFDARLGCYSTRK